MYPNGGELVPEHLLEAHESFHAAYFALDDTKNIGPACMVCRSWYIAEGDYATGEQLKAAAVLNSGTKLVKEALLHFSPPAPVLKDLIQLAYEQPPVRIVPLAIEKLGRKFKSLSDFYENNKKYFLYPSPKFFTAELLTQYLSKAKRMYKVNEAKLISMPKYDELALERFESWRLYPRIALALPDETPFSRTRDRDFFFNIANTAYPGSMAKLLGMIKRERKLDISALPAAENYDDLPEEFKEVMDGLPDVESEARNKFKPYWKNFAKPRPYSVTYTHPESGLTFTVSCP